MPSLKRLFARGLRAISGKKRFQPFFEKLHAIALSGMHYGNGSLMTGSGEPAVIKLVASALSPNSSPIIFDVGANRGDYSVAISAAFAGHSGTKIYAFEPSSTMVAQLRENIAAAGLNDRVAVIQAGLGSERKEQTLFAPAAKSLSGLASVYPRRLEHIALAMIPQESIPLRTLDDFCLEQRIDRINFLKIDVEGHELEVLKGAQRLLANDAIDYIQFEFGGTNIDSRTFFQDFFYLLHDRFALFRIVRDGLFPVDTYRETHEIFTATNYFAARRALAKDLAE